MQVSSARLTVMEKNILNFLEPLFGRNPYYFLKFILWKKLLWEIKKAPFGAFYKFLLIGRL